MSKSMTNTLKKLIIIGGNFLSMIDKGHLQKTTAKLILTIYGFLGNTHSEEWFRLAKEKEKEKSSKHCG